jgi:hypothetical protein
MRKPPTVAEASEQGLLADGAGITTFSNGSEWESWAAHNCETCRHYGRESSGACAFESAAFFGAVSPALAVLFGWTEHPKYPGSYQAPETCAFHREDDDDDRPPAEPTDPRQLVLLADPTEDAAIITNADAPAFALTSEPDR